MSYLVVYAGLDNGREKRGKRQRSTRKERGRRELFKATQLDGEGLACGERLPVTRGSERKNSRIIQLWGISLICCSRIRFQVCFQGLFSFSCCSNET